MRCLSEAAVQAAQVDIMHAMPSRAILFDYVHTRTQGPSCHRLQDSPRVEYRYRSAQANFHCRLDFDFDFDFLFLL